MLIYNKKWLINIYDMIIKEVEMKKLSRAAAMLTALFMSLTVLCFPAAAENDAHYVVTVYNEQNGLPTGEANVIAQTSDGYIWIGSYGGLIRYDGSSFRNYSLENVISSSSIRSLYESTDGKLWIGTNDVGVYTLENDVFTKVECTTENSFLCIRDFAETADGTVFAASNSGVGVIRNGELIPFETDGVFGETFYSIACDKYDHLWLTTTTDSGLVINTDGEILSTVSPDDLGLSAGFYSVANSINGDICVGTEKEIARITFESENLEPSELGVSVHDTDSITTHNSLNVTDNGDILISGLNGFGVMHSDGRFTQLGEKEKALSVNCAIRDYEGNYWLASSSYGVIKYSTGCFDHTNDRSGLENTSINAITKSADRFYIGTDTGLSVFGSDWSPIETELSEMLNGIRIRDIITDKDGRVWMAVYADYAAVCYDPADGSITTYDSSDMMYSNRGRVVYALSDGSVAVGTQHGVAIIRNDQVTEFYDSDDGLTTTSALCIRETIDGALLIGSDGGGIYTIKDGTITNHGFDEGLGEGVVLRMIPDSDDASAWFISAGSSLYYWKDNSFTKLDNFAKGPGSVFDMYDIDGTLWVMQNNGVLSVDKAALLSGNEADTVEHGFTHGLTGSLNANTWNYIDKNGTIYIATRQGVNTFNFHEVENKLPKGIINSITIDGVVYEHPAKLEIPSSASRITIDFAALTYTGTTRLKLAYCLEGFDKRETVLTDENSLTVSYTNLPGGNYTFRISMIDPNGNETPQDISLNIHKARKLTEQPLFWILLTALVIGASVGCVMLVARVKINSIRKRQNEYKRIVEQSLRTFAKTIDAKDPYTNGHSTRVAEYSREIARRMGLSEDEQERIYYIALMHDIGKIGIPDHILNKPGALTEEERRIIQTHVTIGGDILKDFTALNEISKGARYHHERYDGEGYCEKIKGEDIPLVARIIGVADTYDAMSSDRCYRKALPEDVILSELNKGIGTQFDPEIVPYMLDMIADGTAPSQSDR